MEKEEPVKNAKDLVNRYVKHKEDMSCADRKLAEEVIKAAGVDPLIIGGETMKIKAMEKKSSAGLFARIKSLLGKKK